MKSANEMPGLYERRPELLTEWSRLRR
jgi:hypothetical protein